MLPLGRVRSSSTLLPELLRLGTAQKAGPTESVPLWGTREPEPQWLRPEKCMQLRARSLWSNLGPEQCRQGKHTRRGRGQTQSGQETASTPHTRQ